MYCMIFILHSLLVWQCCLCYVAMLLLQAAVCVLHCVGHLGIVVWGGGALRACSACLVPTPLVHSKYLFVGPPFTAITLFSFTALAP